MIVKLINLYYSIRALGLRAGFRYWRLMRLAEKNPIFAIKWCESLRSMANKEDIMGRHSDANILRNFADNLEYHNSNYHKLKS